MPLIEKRLRIPAWRHRLTIAVVISIATVATGRGEPVTKSGVTLPEYTLAVGAKSHLDAAWLLFQQGRIEASRSRLSTAAKTYPNLPPADLMLAQLCLRNQRVEQGKRLLESAAIAHPQHPEVYLAMADRALSEGRLSDASLNTEKAAALKPPSSWPREQISKLERHLLIRRVAIAERREDYDRAEVLVREWLNADPADTSVRRMLARVLFLNGKKDLAYDQLRQVETALSGEMRAEVVMANWHVSAGELPAAATLLEGRLSKDAKDRPVILALAHVRLLGSRSQEAWDLLETIAPEDGGSLDMRMLRGVVAYRLGKQAEALELVGGVYEEAPDKFEASNLLSRLFAQSDQMQRRRTALQLAEANYRKYPNSGEALATLGWVLLRNGRWEAAEKILSAACQRSPDNAEATYHLGMVLEHRGDKPETQRVRERLKKLLEKDGAEFPERRQAINWSNAGAD